MAERHLRCKADAWSEFAEAEFLQSEGSLQIIEFLYPGDRAVAIIRSGRGLYDL